ncbi:MAG: domain containing protein [Marmoricola sp.]|jgi:CBS domain-containing protein|nr:domain containing protein [Marmoricola sp.]
MKINDVIRGKSSREVITIPPDASVRELLALLAEHNIGAVIVSGEGTTVDGIVSERDVVRKLNGDDSVLDAPVRQIMTTLVQTCEPGHDVDDLMAQMTEHRIRHVPVIENGSLVGVVSIGDVVKSRIDQLTFERDQLDSYVHQT